MNRVRLELVRRVRTADFLAIQLPTMRDYRLLPRVASSMQYKCWYVRK